MHSKEYDSESRRPRSRVLVASLVLLAVAVALLALSILENRRTLSFFQDKNAFQMGGGSSPAYAAAGNGLAAATTEEIRLFSSRGKCVASSPVSLAEPACAAGSLLGVYYDVGCPGLLALYPDGAVRQTDTPGPVYFADVNETGLVTVLLEKSGYKGSVMVYDTDLTPLYRWDAGSGYPVSARCAGDDRLCVATVSAQGSVLHFFRIDREEEQASFTAPGELFLDLGFLSDGTVAAVTEEQLCLVRPDGTLAGSHSFEGRHLDAWWLRGQFAAVATVTGRGDGSAVLSTLDSQGQLLGSATVPGSVRALSGAGEWLLALFDGREATLYSSALEEDVSFQPREDTDRVFLSADGRAIFAGGSGAVQIDFER